MTDEFDPKKDRIGPGNPPKEHRFKKGISGNPKGRPRKSEINYDQVWHQEGRELITISEDGTRKQITKMEALIRSTYTRALKGDHKAAKIVFDYEAKLQRIKSNAAGKYWHALELMADDEIEALVEQNRKESIELKSKK